jgi:hypothetical protein
LGCATVFCAADYSAVWDGGEFDTAKDPHELVLAINDGRQVTMKISEEALGNPWRPLRAFEDAFRKLQRRARPRRK